MLGSISQRVLPVLQLTRLALVFTAIADSTCGLLLRAAAARQRYGGSILSNLDLDQLIATAIISAGLYGFGMSFNDIIDRRRDSTVAAHRPLPSGRIGVVTAHVICGLLLVSALLAGGYFPYRGFLNGIPTLLLVILTASLITFYDLAGKYLVAPGLLALGLIRFFHALIPAPAIPVVWHPLLLFNHIVILSTVCYVWEEKRPALSPLHWWTLLGGLALVDGAALGLLYWLRRDSLWVSEGLMLPGAAVLLFIAVAIVIWKRMGMRREAGQTLMMYGLLWLIVYDAAFAAAYVNLLACALLLVLLPVAYLSVQLMRWWSKLIIASQRPEYRRAGV